MKTTNNANNMETTIKNAKFKVEFWDSDGLGNISNKHECRTNIEGLKYMFSSDKIVDYVQRWLAGEDFRVEEEIFEDEFLVIRAPYDGGLLIEFRSRYVADDYDNAPVYRYNDDVYLITLEE